LPWSVKIADAQPLQAGSTPGPLQDNQFLLYAAQDGDIRLTPQRVTQGAYFPAYQINNQVGEVVL
jgi:hypothetical protein